MELLIEAGLWMLMISGSFALLGLAAEGVERFCEKLEERVESFCSLYLDTF